MNRDCARLPARGSDAAGPTEPGDSVLRGRRLRSLRVCAPRRCAGERQLGRGERSRLQLLRHYIVLKLGGIVTEN